MYLRDITFAYDGNNDYLDEDTKKLINLDKLRVVHDLISEIKSYQKDLAHLPVDQDPALSNYLLEITYLDEGTLHEKSLQIEPPRGAVNTPSTLLVLVVVAVVGVVVGCCVGGKGNLHSIIRNRRGLGGTRERGVYF